MARMGIRIKIDVSKIDKARLYKGQKGTYLDATMFVDPDEANEYGQHGMITQDVPKAEREAGEKGAILGNATVFYREGGQAQQGAPAAQPDKGEDLDDEVSF